MARPQRVITPVDSVHRTVLVAIERRLLPNLIVDYQALASEQMRSRYLVKLLEWGKSGL